jgi:LmbE family N-acetylglucosaminyl deacetylase
MNPLRLENLRTLLCIGAHCDDIEIGCGGTLLKLLAERPELEVHWVVFSADGVRGEEAKASAEAMLSPAAKKRIVLHQFPDTCFPFVGMDIKEKFRQLQVEASPDLIFTHRLEDRHQDHRLLSELTWNAFRDHLILEYEIPKYEGDLGQPNFFVPLDKDVCRQKIEHIMKRFPSQRQKPWFTADAFQALLRLRGVECNAPQGFAEAFTSRKAVLG